MEILRLGNEPSTANGGAVTLPWVEKPTPLGAGKVTRLRKVLELLA